MPDIWNVCSEADEYWAATERSGGEIARRGMQEQQHHQTEVDELLADLELLDIAHEESERRGLPGVYYALQPESSTFPVIQDECVRHDGAKWIFVNINPMLALVWYIPCCRRYRIVWLLDF